MSARGAADGGLQNLWRYKIEQPLREGYMSKQSCVLNSATCEPPTRNQRH